MSIWRSTTLGDVVTFQRGFDITRATQREGSVPVVSSGGIGSFHDTAAVSGPGVVIGRKGTLGKVFYMPDDYWPHDTTLWVKDFKGSVPKFVYFFMTQLDTSWLDAGSANPTLNRNHLHPVSVLWPPVGQQRAIAEVLGALDDKIAANTRVSLSAFELAGLVYDRAVALAPIRSMSEVLTPILGGTPSRSRTDYWGGSNLWASARDVTGASSGVLINTVETISELAVADTKAKPLPSGSVILTARGTVGAVARLARPASFNQSCYGFRPGALPAGVLYFSILRATERAKAFAHGSVFDTITMKTFDHLHVPDMNAAEVERVEAVVGPLLDAITAAVRENETLAATRDALLPQLMSGKLRVRDVEKTLEGVL